MDKLTFDHEKFREQLRRKFFVVESPGTRDKFSKPDYWGLAWLIMVAVFIGFIGGIFAVAAQ